MATLGLKEYRNSVKKGAKRSKEEENIQLAVCLYVKTKYPNVIFTCDLASGMKMPIWLAARNKKMRSSSGLPDFMMLEPSGQWRGLIIEFKKEDVKVFKKDGFTPATPHLKEQWDIIVKLREKGYNAQILCGYKAIIDHIDYYMSLPSESKNIIQEG